MKNHFIFVVVLALLAYPLLGSIATPIIFFLIYLIGLIGLKIFNSDDQSFRIFGITYGAFFIYALMLNSYMEFQGYNYLQSYDGINVYLPYTEELLEVTSIIELISIIYNTSKYAFVGSILIPFVYIGKLSAVLGGNLYLPIQLVIMLFAAWTSVVVDKILRYKSIEASKAFKYTIIYSLISVHFMMSVFIVRDMPVTFFYSVLILLSFKPFSVKRFWTMVLVVLAIMSLRMASGMFASLYILLVLIMSRKAQSSVSGLVRYLLIVGVVIVSLNFFNQVQSLFESKQENYLEKQMEANDGASTIASFNQLPVGISHFVKAAYNQFMPIPSWRTMIKTSFRPESYNIMNFPTIPATYFRYFVWVTVILGLLHKRIRNVILNDRLLFYSFLIGILFLLVQSNTMGHRRMMGVYPVFYLVAILVYERFNFKSRRMLRVLAFSLFISLQVIGVYYLM